MSLLPNFKTFTWLDWVLYLTGAALTVALFLIFT